MEKVLKRLIIVVIYIASLLLQLFVLNKISIFGISPNIILIFVIVISMYLDIYEVAFYSFATGVIMDLLFGTGGIYTICYTLCGMLLSFLGDNYMKGNYLTTMVFTIIGVVFFEIIRYIEEMIALSRYISIFFLLKDLIFSIILNSILVTIMFFIFEKIVKKIGKEQDKMYW